MSHVEVCFEKRGAVLHLWSNKDAIDCLANGRRPLNSFELKGSEETLDGFNDVSEMLLEVDIFAGDGKAEVFIRKEQSLRRILR